MLEYVKWGASVDSYVHLYGSFVSAHSISKSVSIYLPFLSNVLHSFAILQPVVVYKGISHHLLRLDCFLSLE